MPNFSQPSLHGVDRISAEAWNLGFPHGTVLRLTVDGEGKDLVLPIFLPAEKAAYAQRLAAAISAVPVDEPTEQISEDRRVPRYPGAAE